MTPCGLFPAPESFDYFTYPIWPHLTPCQPSQSSMEYLSALTSTPHDPMWTFPSSWVIWLLPLLHMAPSDPMTAFTVIHRTSVSFNIRPPHDHMWTFSSSWVIWLLPLPHMAPSDPMSTLTVIHQTSITKLNLQTIKVVIYCCLPTVIWWKSRAQVILPPPWIGLT